MPLGYVRMISGRRLCLSSDLIVRSISVRIPPTKSSLIASSPASIPTLIKPCGSWTACIPRLLLDMTIGLTHTTGEQVRLACRAGSFRGPTAGQAPGHIQANLIVLPQRYANDFRGLCRRNPVSCPLLGENVAPGDPRLQPELAADSDVRTDAPGYNV